jgi:hypothetical protein
MKDHIKHLRFVFSKLKEANLNINPEKVQLLCDEFKFLGMTFKRDSEDVLMFPNKKKIKGLDNYPTPQSQSDIRKFNGFVQYYKEFIPNLQKFLKPINRLQKKNVKFKWSDECQQSLVYIINFIKEKAVLLVPDLNKTFRIHTDASNLGIGCVLSQQDSNGKWRPVEFRSRALNNAEMKMSTTHKECLAIKYALDKFRYYIEYIEFELYTDHKALEYLMTTKDLSGKLARWAITIQEFKMKIIHKPGKLNIVADALSRVPAGKAPEDKIDEVLYTIAQLFSEQPIDKPPPDSTEDILCFNNTTDNPIPTSTMMIAQKKDSICVAIKEYLFHNKLPDNPKMANNVKVLSGDCVIINEILYKHIPDWDSRYFDVFLGNFKIVVPKALIDSVLKTCHDNATAGHVGFQKTLYNVTQRYYWSSMFKDTEHYCKTCTVCQQVKKPTTKELGYMTGYKPLKPFDVLAVDLMGPYPRSKLGNLYMLVIVDMFTKIVEIFPLKSDETTVIVQKVFITCCRYSFPTAILSDNGPQFISNVWNGLMRKLRIDPLKCPPHAARCNLAERVIKNIKSFIKAYTLSDNNYKEWDRDIPYLIMMLRATIHCSIGMTPFELMFGRKYHNPIHDYLEFEIIFPETVTDFKLAKKELVERLEAYIAKAREYLVKAKIESKYFYDKKHTDKVFKVGDMVWKALFSLSSFAKGTCARLDPTWEGPYKVIALIGNEVYALSNLENDKFITAAHISQLAEFKSREERPPFPEPIGVEIPPNTLGKIHKR